MQTDIIPHLFRTEFRKMTAVLCRQFGLAHLETAEDIVSETFLSALETWPYKGLPEAPEAWLYTVAKNKLKNHLKRDQRFHEKIAPAIRKLSTADVQLDWSEQNIADSQLAMLFALSHHALSTEAQVALSLRLLCGFGIEEIATAFLTNKETINKRLHRAKEKLRRANIAIAIPGENEIVKRLDPVLKTLYLLFSEGYYSESGNAVLQKDLCAEAIHLTYLLLQNEKTATPAVAALLSLMCFQASRFDARARQNGEMILYEQQDEKNWNRTLIEKGIFFLHQSSVGNELSTYHLEAAIACWHTQKNETPEKWRAILSLYDHLLAIQHSPVAALNRIYALSKLEGAQAAIHEALRLDMKGNRFYYALLGYLHKAIESKLAKQYFEKALSLTSSPAEQQVLRRHLQALCATAG